MFVICDSANIVQDIATEKANLSRGYAFAGHKPYENVGLTDIAIGDTFDGSTVTPNVAEREKAIQQQQNEALISRKVREIAITALKAEGKLPGDYTDAGRSG